MQTSTGRELANDPSQVGYTIDPNFLADVQRQPERLRDTLEALFNLVLINTPLELMGDALAMLSYLEGGTKPTFTELMELKLRAGDKLDGYIASTQ